MRFAVSRNDRGGTASLPRGRAGSTAALVMALALSLADCGGDGGASPQACGPKNCAGCCMDGVCQSGSASTSCGTSGAACLVCGATQMCSGTCVSAAGKGEAGAAGKGDAGAGGSSTMPASGAGGATSNAGEPDAGTTGGSSGAIGGRGGPGEGGAVAGSAGITASGGGGAGGSRTPTWTVMVYANGDNNIVGDLMSDLQEMAAATLDPGINVIAYLDFPAQTEVPGSAELFPSGTQVYQILGKGHGEPPLVASAPEEDFDDPKVLENAVKTVFSMFPSDRRALILWDHGGAWRLGYGGDGQNGTRTVPTSIPFERAAQAVRAGLAAAGVRAAPPLEVFSFDTCLLGTPEVASAFADLTKVYIGNAELDYGAGWDYTNTLSWLSAHPAASAADFARQESLFWDAHHSKTQDDKLFKSHAALDMSALPSLAASIDTMVGAAQINKGAYDVARAFDISLPDYFVENINDTSPPFPLKDLGQVLSSLRQSQSVPIAAAAAAAQTSMNSLILARVNGLAREGQAGLNVGAGVPLEFTSLLSVDYRKLVTTWSGATHWADLLDFVRASSDGVGPKISSTGVFAGRQLPFTIDDPDLLSVELTLLRSVNDRLYVLQLLNRLYTAPGTYDFMWSGNVGAINATPSPVLVTLAPWRDVSSATPAPPILTAFGTLRNGTEELAAELLVDVTTLSAELAVVYLDALPTVLPIAALADPATVFTPTFVYLDRQGAPHLEAGPTAVTLAGEAVGFTSVSPPKGNYAFELEAKDVWGNTTAQLYGLTVP